MISICENPACPKPNGVFEAKRRTRRFCGHACGNAVTAAKRAASRPKPSTIVWTCGGGIDSTAIALMICKGLLPKPDVGIMMDCSYEHQGTVRYMHDVLIPRLAEVGVPLHFVPSSEYDADLSCVDRHGLVRIPAFRKLSDGRIIKLRTWCNSGWKQKPCKRWLKARGIERYIGWLGISADEAYRIRPQQNVDSGKVRSYPLMEHGWTRERCIYELGAAGWEVPPRSSCVLCPSQADRQWALVDSVPGDREKAIEAEAEIRAIHPDTWLHKSCAPIADVMLNLRQRVEENGLVVRPSGYNCTGACALGTCTCAKSKSKAGGGAK